MRKKLERIANHCVNVASSPVTWFLVGIFAVVLFSFIMDAVKTLRLWKDMVTLPEPEQCALCADDGILRPYPCLVKLATGQVGQIWVQDTEGHVCGFFVTDCFATAEGSTTSVTLPEKQQQIDPMQFCRDCRTKLAEVSTAGYVLADLYDAADIRFYPVTNGAAYEIRGYTVEVSEQTVTVTKYLE